jgi:hypothetical protein
MRSSIVFVELFVRARTNPSAAGSNGHRYAAPAFESRQAELALPKSYDRTATAACRSVKRMSESADSFSNSGCQLIPSFRGDAEHRTRNLEIPGLRLTAHPGMTEPVVSRRFAPQSRGALVLSKHTFTTSPRGAPESLMNPSPKEGVGNAGCPLHPRPRVQL